MTMHSSKKGIFHCMCIFIATSYIREKNTTLGHIDLGQTNLN